MTIRLVQPLLLLSFVLATLAVVEAATAQGILTPPFIRTGRDGGGNGPLWLPGVSAGSQSMLKKSIKSIKPDDLLKASPSVRLLSKAGDVLGRDIPGVDLTRAMNAVTGVAEESLQCAADSQKCGGSLRTTAATVKINVEEDVGESLKWAGRRLVDLGRFEQKVAEELDQVTPALSQAFARIQSAALDQSPAGQPQLDPMFLTLDSAARVTGDESAKDKYEAFVKKNKVRIGEVGVKWFDIQAGAISDAAQFSGNANEMMGEIAVLLGHYITQSAQGFPKAVSAQDGDFHGKADITAAISQKGLADLLKGLNGEHFSMGKATTEDEGKEYVSVQKFTVDFDPSSRTILVNASKIRVRTQLLKGYAKFHVSRLILQLIPDVVIVPKHNREVVKLLLKARVIFLDADGIPTRVDQMLAYILNDYALHKAQEIDLTDVLAPTLRIRSAARGATGEVEKTSREWNYPPIAADFAMSEQALTFLSRAAEGDKR